MRYRADIMFNTDRDADDFALWLEDVLYSVSTQHDAVMEITLYEVRDLPSFAEMVRREHERRVIDRSPEDPT